MYECSVREIDAKSHSVSKHRRIESILVGGAQYMRIAIQNAKENLNMRYGERIPNFLSFSLALLHVQRVQQSFSFLLILLVYISEYMLLYSIYIIYILYRILNNDIRFRISQTGQQHMRSFCLYPLLTLAKYNLFKSHGWPFAGQISTAFTVCECVCVCAWR